jgi:hypothetical protein
MTHYRRGDFFRKHSDASFLNEKMWACAAQLAEVDEDGCQEALNWPSRFVTIFIYLNDVEQGGRTCFRWLDGAGMPGFRLFEQVLASQGGTEAASDEETSAEPHADSSDIGLNIEPRAGMAVVVSPLSYLFLLLPRLRVLLWICGGEIKFCTSRSLWLRSSCTRVSH